MSTITKAFFDEIEKIEKASLISTATRCGISENAVVALCIKNINLEMDDFTKQGSFTPIKSEQDYWDFVHEGYQIERDIAIEIICEFLKNNFERVDFNAVHKMALAIGFAEKEILPTPDFLRNFLSSVPVVTLFDYEFNANASRGFLFENVPVVRHFDFLHRSLNLLLYHICSFALKTTESDGNVIFEYYEEYLDSSSDYFKFATQQIDQILYMTIGYVYDLGTEIKTFNLPDEQKINLLRIAGAFYQIGSSFVWIHEFSHILFGDVLSDQWQPSMEYRCDKFAAECLKHWEKYEKQMVAFSVDFLFILMKVLIEIKEALSNNTNKTASKFIYSRFRTVNDFLIQGLNKRQKKNYDSYTHLIKPIILAP